MTQDEIEAWQNGYDGMNHLLEADEPTAEDFAQALRELGVDV